MIDSYLVCKSVYSLFVVDANIVGNKLNVSVLSCHFDVDSLAGMRSKFKLPVRFFSRATT